MQIFYKSLDGSCRCLAVQSDDSIATVKGYIESKEGVPAAEQGLVFGARQLQDGRTLSDYAVTRDATLRLVLRLRGGKGGFGALLRGAGRAALTDNFDACRDLSGKRLRHVNGEKKLREWAKQSKELKQALADLKRAKDEEKKAKKQAGTQAELTAVRASQRTALSGVLAALEDGLVASGAVQRSKRPAEESSSAPPAKKARMFDLDSFDIDSDLSDSDEDDWSDADSLYGLAAAVTGTGSADSDQEAAPTTLHTQQQPDASSKPSAESGSTPAGDRKPQSPTQMAQAVVSAAAGEAQAPPAEHLPLQEDDVSIVGQGDDVSTELDLQQYSSAKELEAVGLDRLKQELQKQGLKCGGTLADRAARLFLIKDTPVEKLEAKHFAKAAKK